MILTPLLGVVAALAAMTKEGIVSARWASLQNAFFSPGGRTLCAAASVFVVVSLIHAVETVKFVASWSDYRNAIVVLATSSNAQWLSASTGQNIAWVSHISVGKPKISGQSMAVEVHA